MVGPASSSSSSSSNWRNPPTALQAKFNLTALPEDFEPTAEEKELLEMYETIRTYEKEAARLKEEAARAKLDAAAAKYEQQNQKEKAPKKKKKKKKLRKQESDGDIQMGDFNDDDSGGDDDEDDEDDAESDPEDIHQKREAKLAEWREEIAERNKEEAKEEEMRAKMLASNDDDMMDMGPSLKRKRHDGPEMEKNEASLIANIGQQATPPHEFSRKLDLKSWAGKLLFPADKTVSLWSPPASAMNPNDEALEFELSEFDISQARAKGNNTLAIKYMAPAESKRFSINIAAPGHRQYDSVLFHFNPRQFEKGGQLVLNSKQEGLWGQSVSVPLSRVPKIFGETACSLMIQIHDDGFDVYIEDRHCARLEHREPIPSSSGGKLFLQFPATDDYGSPERWSVYRVWWGHKEIMAKDDLTNVYGVNAYSGMHPVRQQACSRFCVSSRETLIGALVSLLCNRKNSLSRDSARFRRKPRWRCAAPSWSVRFTSTVATLVLRLRCPSM